MFLFQIILSFTTSIAFAQYNVNSERGLFTNKFKSPNHIEEQCVIPQRIPGLDTAGDYYNKRMIKELELCSFNFYDVTSEIAICPKTNSTNPGVDVFSPASYQCFAKDGGKKIAKFKQSISCSYTPSILAYYQLSLWLKALNVPPAVVRTMDIDTHEDIRQKALSHLGGSKSKMIYKTWDGSWNAAYRAPAGERGRRVFTDDQRQVYGALSVNPRGENRYTEVYGRYGSYEERFKSLVRQPAYLLVNNSKALRQIAGVTPSQDSVQTVVLARDMADMLVMDYILGQQDRPGNIHYKMTEELGFKIKAMILKDNDCGIIKGNAAKQLGLLNHISHIDHKTYYRLRNLAAQWRSNTAAMKTYFETELLFTSADISVVSKDLLDLDQLLSQRCQQGVLHLDANPELHFSAEAIPTDCSAQTSL